MLELALHILDIAENSTRAGAKNICINIEEGDIQDILRMDISDDGLGMSHETLEKALDPFYTTKKVRRVGLGLPMLKAAAERTGGNFSITSEMGVGTTVSVTFGLSNIDRQPLGDIPGVLVALITGNPDVDFRYAHRTRHGCYEMDTRNIRKELEDVPIQRIEVLQFIRRHVQEGLQEIASLS
jgi:anti-sigma regulatory factor (Ser/Thr protein kinase)